MNHHWNQRCRERGVTSVCPNALRLELEAAIRCGDDTKVQFVMSVPALSGDGNRIYRFYVPDDGIFYAMATPGGTVMTLLTQEMIRTYKRIRRGEVTGRRDAEHQDVIAMIEKGVRGKRRRLKRGRQWA